MRLPPGIFEQTMRVMYGYNDIHEAKFSRTELIERLETFPPWAVIDTLSKLSVLLTNLDVQSVTAQIWNAFLPQETKVKIMKKATARKDPKILLLSDRSLCILTEFARRHCRSGSKKDIDQEYLYRFGECILIANDMATESAFPKKLGDANLPEEERKKEVARNFATFTTREFLFNSSEQFRYTLARSNLIYDLLQHRVKPEDYFDVSAALEQRLGFTLQDFFHTSLAIRSYWANQDQTWDREHTNIDPAIIFPSGPRTANYLRVLEHLSQDFAIDNDPIPTAREEFHQWQYKFFNLRSKPLLRVEGRLYCASMKFLGDLFWNGPYFLGLNHFGNQKDNFQRYIGGATEVYVLDLLKDCVGKKIKFNKTSKGNPVGECVIEMRKNWHVIVEVKAGRADTRLQTEAADPAQSPKVAKMLYDGLKQMSDRIAELRADGFKGRITPVLITGGHLPLNSVAWEHYLGTCGGLSIFNDADVDFAQVMDLEAIESVCALLKTGSRLGKLLTAKLKPQWIRQDMTVFFRNEWYPIVGPEPAHPVLIALNHEIFNNLAKGLNVTDEEFEADETWRPVFGLELKS